MGYQSGMSKVFSLQIVFKQFQNSNRRTQNLEWLKTIYCTSKSCCKHSTSLLCRYMILKIEFILNKVLLQVGVERKKRVKMRSHINYPLSGCYPLRSLSNFWGLFYCHWISNEAKNDNSFFSRLNEIIFSVSREWITNKIVLATFFRWWWWCC